MQLQASRIIAMGVLTVALTGWSRAAEAPAALLDLEHAFTQVAEQAFPAVVVITNKQSSRRPYSPMYPQLPPEFRRFFGVPDAPGTAREPNLPQAVGKGSGVIVSADGLVLTNYHVIRDQDALEVRLHDGRVFDSEREPEAVKVIGTDPETDLALLRIGNGAVKDLPILSFADSDQVRVGQWAIAVGAPFDMDYSVTVGVVSQKGRYDVRMNTYENYIQTDASINPGNSGGPLLNISGQIMGINDFIVTGGGMSRGSVGLGFAISSNLVRQVFDDLLEHGEVVRPWLGIAMQPFTPELREQFSVDGGVLISEVVAGDPADEAGLRAGDVILKVGDKPVRTPHDVQFAVLPYEPGEQIMLAINRAGELLSVAVTARRKDGKAVVTASGGGGDRLEELGLVLEEDSEPGLVVAKVSAGSVASQLLQPGDRVLEVNRQAVQKLKDVVAALDAPDRAVAIFYIERAGRKLFVPLRLLRDGTAKR